MRDYFKKIPETIQQLIGPRPYYIDDIGKSSSQVICFDDMILKIQESCEESENELRMIKWLQRKLPVPRILHEERADNTQFLLMSRILGQMSCDESYMDRESVLIELLAQGLKMLWSVDITDCPYSNSLEQKLRQARGRVEQGLCDMENVQEDTYGENGFRDPSDLLSWLETHKPQEDLVLAHGDYCLPNVFLQDDKISGFIDLGRCGIADRYQDIALCYRSLLNNYQGAYGGKAYSAFHPERLFEALEIKPDWEKVRYYILLDELF